MLGSGSAGNSALVATDHCKILVDGGLSARQLVLRLEQCGVTPEQLDGVLLTHEHGDHVCGLKVLCRKFDVPIYCNALTAEAVRCDGSFERHRNWRIFVTGAEFSICNVTVQTFPVPHDAVDPLGFAFYAGSSGLGFITDLGYPTKMVIERLREVQSNVSFLAISAAIAIRPSLLWVRCGRRWRNAASLKWSSISPRNHKSVHDFESGKRGPARFNPLSKTLFSRPGERRP